MNLLLFTAQELDAHKRLVLRDRRLQHIVRVLDAKVGDRLRVGQIGAQLGEGLIEALSSDAATLRVTLSAPPPAPLGLTVVLALPRPKMLRRILHSLAEAGVKDIHLIHSYRVEKSYWQSPLLGDAKLQATLQAGLEQGMDTILPAVHLHRRFRPFAEDYLPGLCAERHALLAQPGAAAGFPAVPATPGLILIGPEGGFIPFECELLCAAGARPVSLGKRVLRVETALHCALGSFLLTGN